MADLRRFSGPNEAYVLEQYERFAADPQSVDAGWRAYFADFVPPAPEAAGAAAFPSSAAPAAVDV
ncbi:MAG: 2-oxoglutarate dehydrogenase component, partial [Gemmatimonadetes bacterium]|nr:2-oxoglutarate dehydrogenase component [Gemmatimonadota bacterium]